MKILVTGASGFVGRHLLAQLLSHDVTGTTHRSDTARLHADFPRVQFRAVDILDGPAIACLVKETCPDVCFHLSGIASVDAFERDARSCLRVNAEGWLNVLEAFRRGAPRAKILFISTSQVYGEVPPKRLPITEDEPVNPGNFYSVSKSTGEQLARVYQARFGLRVVVLRPFNHIGPGQSTSFVCANLARQVAQIPEGQDEAVLRAGNMESQRDFTDVRDIARAYRLAAERCNDFGPYNICSGKAVKTQEILDRLLDLADVKARVKVEKTMTRPLDQKIIVGSCDKFRAIAQWAPTIPLDQTLRDTLEYWKGIGSNHAAV